MTRSMATLVVIQFLASLVRANEGQVGVDSVLICSVWILIHKCFGSLACLFRFLFAVSVLLLACFSSAVWHFGSYTIVSVLIWCCFVSYLCLFPFRVRRFSSSLAVSCHPMCQSTQRPSCQLIATSHSGLLGHLFS